MRCEEVAIEDCCIQMTALKIDKNSFYLIIDLKCTIRSVSAIKANVPRDANKTNKKFDQNQGIVLKEIIVVDWKRKLQNRNEW